MPHDFDAQRAATLVNFAELQADNDLPDEADLTFFLAPDTRGGTWEPLAEALAKQGYICDWIEDDGAPFLAATLPDQMLTGLGIAIAEEVATKIALEHGFSPDGWEFAG